MEFFLLNVLLKVFLFLKVCDRNQVELEAMVLNYPKFYNHEYCSLVVIFHSSSLLCDENRSVKCVKGGESSSQFQWFTIAKIEL